MGILPSKESHEYPGAFHFAKSGSHAMAILPLTEHFFSSVDSLAFKQLYACRDMQSAKYNFSLVSPPIITKYRERAMEQLRAKAASGEADGKSLKNWWVPRPCLTRGADADAHENNTSEMDVMNQEVEEELKKWVEVDTINDENFGQFFRNDTRCVSPDEADWPFPQEEELCSELRNPNPSAHWRTHDAAKQYLQLVSHEVGPRTTPFSTAGAGAEKPSNGSNADPQSPPSYQHANSVSFGRGVTPEAAAEYADQEREYVDKFFSRSPEALYQALVVEPNKGFLVDTNKEMCEIYAAEMRWKEARKIVRAYRRQCKEDEAAAAEAGTPNDGNKESSKNASPADATASPGTTQEPPQRRITKEEAEEAEKVPPPSLFLRPAPQVIVVRINREEEEATRAKYFADQQRKQKKRRSSNVDDETASVSSRSAQSRATSSRSPGSESTSALPNSTPKSPTPSSISHLHTPTTRYHRFEDEERYKDGRIHLVEEDGVLYMFAYNTAYVDPRRQVKEKKQRREEQQKRKSADTSEQPATPSLSGAGDTNDSVAGDVGADMLCRGSRQTSSFYQIVDAFGAEEPQSASLEDSKKAATEGNKSKKSAVAPAPSAMDDLEDDDDTALSSKRGGRERQQDTAIFIDDAESHRPKNARESATDDESDEDEDDEDGSTSNRRGQGGTCYSSRSVCSESTAATSPTERPRQVHQLQLLTAAPFILPICAVRVVGCNGYTESSCRGTPWLRGTDDDPEEDAYIESLPVRPPVMSGGGFIDANIGDKILSRAFLLGLQVFRNVCLDAGLPETLTRPFWTLGLLSNIPLLQISREMRFRMRAAAAEVRLGFQGLRDMIKGTENDLQSYIYGFSDILPYLEKASQARLQQAAEEEAAANDEDGDGGSSWDGLQSSQMLHPLLLLESNEPYTLPTRASQPEAQRSLRLPRQPIEFYTQLTIRGNQCLSRVRTESQMSFFHLIAEATAPVSTSLFMKPLELKMYDYGGAIRLHLLKKKATGETEMQVVPPPKNLGQLISEHQRRVQLRRLAKQEENTDGTATVSAIAAATAVSDTVTEDKGSTNSQAGVCKSAKEQADIAMPPYLVYTIAHPSSWAKGPSLKHYRRIMQGPDGQSSETDEPTTVDLADAELLSMCDPAATATSGGAPATRCTCHSGDGQAQPVFAPHQYLYEADFFGDGDMVVYNVHAGRWEHFEYFHRQQLARRRAQRERQRQLKLRNAHCGSNTKDNAEGAGEQQQQADGAVKCDGVQMEPSNSAGSVCEVQAEDKSAADDLSDEDEEDIHQEDILLCWIKRRLQSAAARNRQDPGWLRDSEDHIVQEGRYYIWGFEHDDQRYFYGLIPKFAKERKAKRHNKMLSARASKTSMSKRNRRHGGGGGGSIVGTPSAMFVGPSVSSGGSHEPRRLSIGGQSNYYNGDSSSGRARNNNSPSARSAHSSQSPSICTPRSQQNGAMGSGGGSGMRKSVIETIGNDFGESSGSYHMQADTQIVASLPNSQTRRAQHSPMSNSNNNNNNNSSGSRRSMRAGEDGGSSAKGTASKPAAAPASTAAGGGVTASTAATTVASSNNSSSGSAVRPGRAGQKLPPRVSAFLAATAAQSAASAMKSAESSSSSSSFASPAPASTRSAGNPYPPRIVSAPLHTASLKGVPPPSANLLQSAASSTAGARAGGGNGSSHSLPSSSNERMRGRGGRQMITQDTSPLPPPPPPPPPQQQQQPLAEPSPYPAQRQHPEYTPAGVNLMASHNRRGPAMHASAPQQPHLHPPTVYMSANAATTHGCPLPQQQQQSQLPQPRHAQQQQQQSQGPLSQVGPQVYPSYNPQVQRQQQQSSFGQQQQQMNAMSGPDPQGSSMSPPPPQQQQSMPDAPPPPPPSMPMNARRHPNSNNSNMMGGGSGGPQGVYADPSRHQTPSPSFHSSYYPEAPLPQQQQLPPPPPLSTQHPPHGKASGNLYSASPPPPQQQQQQQQQASYASGPNMGNQSGAMYGDAGMPPQVAPQQHHRGMPMRASPTMPHQQSMRNANVSAMGGSQSPMVGGAHPPYPLRQMGHVNTPTAPQSAHVSSSMPASNRGGNDMGMFSSNSSTVGHTGASPTSTTSNNAGGGWGNQPWSGHYNTNSSSAPASNPVMPASSGRAGGPTGNNGPYPMPSTSPYLPPASMNMGGGGAGAEAAPAAAMTGRSSAYPAWGSVPNTVSERNIPLQQQQGPYQGQARDVGYAHDSYAAAGGMNNSTTSNNSRSSSFPYPQQYSPQQQQQQQQQYGGPAGSTGMTGSSSTYAYPSAQQQQQQQPFCPAPTHSSTYSKSVSASPSLSYASHPSASHEPLATQQQHFSQHGCSSSNNHSSSPYGYTGANSPYPQHEELQQQHSSSVAPVRSSSSNISAQSPQQQPQRAPSANVSGILLRSSPSPQQRQYQQLQQQRYQEQQQQQHQQQGIAAPVQLHSVRQSPAPQQQHSLAYNNLENAQQLQCSGDSHRESGNYDATNSPGQQSRFAHNPYAMQ
ncbi:hypothetical protein ABL78_0209 [Leptomonas seymouri]|uniref:Uncharacterized protein n=1 Tax=Leptomonas seymouri TaxID=5684 RepID=A0A0N1IMT2_LEPSE|nr:hypothetical protein ABL78_0209 [Leptomonas seymouri]|eukprot:KPI90613.1 hypothetical protein ABL78_0209 [Leptomonas seymouri]